MRNSIQVLAPTVVNLTIADLEMGQLFRFKYSTGGDAVYIKMEGLENKAVHLQTGNVFEIDDTAVLVKISLIQIGSGS